MVEKFSKYIGFRLFVKRFDEYREHQAFNDKLNYFSSEVYRRKAFTEFVEKLAIKRIKKISIERKYNDLILHLKKKRFNGFVNKVTPHLRKIHNDMAAVKNYVLILSKRHLNAWKAYTFSKVQQEKFN
mmetsp:Transcript_21482/g.18552  ORF Transcript_21482/g.18552 Transcript_21482/m.18552 type:complete len:128 (+) Transcript_21482:195-578(+)